MTDHGRDYAIRAHAGQTDKGGRPYIEHVERVAAHVPFAYEDAAWLHDVVEDTDATLDDLRSAAFTPRTVEAVDALTHRKGERNIDYYARVRGNPIARTVKLADIADNANVRRLARLDDETIVRLVRKYARALDELA